MVPLPEIKRTGHRIRRREASDTRRWLRRAAIFRLSKVRRRDATAPLSIQSPDDRIDDWLADRPNSQMMSPLSLAGASG